MAATRGLIAGTANLHCFSSSSVTRLAASSSYYDRSQRQYYGGAVKVYCGKKSKIEKQARKGLSALQDGSLSDKKRMQLLESVSKDLSALSNTFAEGKDADKYSLVEEVRGQILSGALRILMTQLEQMKAERKQRKKEMKAQKKAQKKLQKKVVFPDILVEGRPNIAGLLHGELAERKESLGCGQVQVCMGGKCKKLGSEQLLVAFEESIENSGMGSAVEAVGCKCMGKCKNAPNVRVHSDFSKELYMGVEIGDADTVLDHHFGLKAQI